MAGYTKEFLLDAFVHRFRPLGMRAVDEQFALADRYYDEVGKDKFRVAASLDAAAIREYRAAKTLT